MFLFKRKKKPQSVEDIEDKSAEGIIKAFYGTSDSQKREIAKSDEFKAILEKSPKDDICKLHWRGYITIEEAIDTGKADFEDLFHGNISYIGVDSYLKLAPEEYKLKYIGSLVGGLEIWDVVDANFKLDSDTTLNIWSDGRQEESVISFKNSSGVYYVNPAHIFTLALHENRIVLNGKPSQFKFDEGFDAEKIKGLLGYLHSRSIDNSKRIEKLLESQRNQPTEQTYRAECRNEPDPWVVGAVALAFGLSV